RFKWKKPEKKTMGKTALITAKETHISTLNADIFPVKSTGFYIIYILLKDSTILCAKGPNLIRYHSDGRVEQFKSEYDILSLYQAKDELIYVGTRKNGVVTYHSADLNKPIRKLQQEYSISSIIQDKDDGFWLSTLEDGIIHIPYIGGKNYKTSY